MERIQSALDRARSRRQGKNDAPVQPPRSQPAAAPAAGKLPPDVRAAWEALVEFKPDPAVLDAHCVAAFERTKLSKPLDMLRTKIVQIMSDNSWQRLAITSPSAGCGKTTISLNLAFSIARQSEQRVAVIEMDMRRPNIEATLGMSGKQYQFAEALAGRSPLQDQLFRIGDNMLVGSNHRVAKHPSELMQSSTMRDALAELEATYKPTITIFDMPPMLVTDDVMAFADKVDGVILVAAAESTSIKEVDVCESELAERTNVLGVVLNKCRYMGKDYGYDYYS